MRASVLIGTMGIVIGCGKSAEKDMSGKELGDAIRGVASATSSALSSLEAYDAGGAGGDPQLFVHLAASMAGLSDEIKRQPTVATHGALKECADRWYAATAKLGSALAPFAADVTQATSGPEATSRMFKLEMTWDKSKAGILEPLCALRPISTDCTSAIEGAGGNVSSLASLSRTSSVCH